MTRLVRAGWIGSILTAWVLATGLGIGVVTNAIADDKKPDEKKTEEKKPEDKKPEDKKPEDKKPDDKKPDAKPEDRKPDAKKPDAKKADDKKADDKKADDKKADEKPSKLSSLSDEETYELFQTFVDTLDQVERNYVKKLTRKELMEAAIQGVLTKLDPYSSYVKPEDLDSFKSNVENKFGGIGIQVSFDNGQLRVLSPMYNTPAYRAGIQAGDVVLEIEGKPTREMTMDQCVHTLKGTPGTKVNVTIQHLNGKKELLALVREIVRVETVLGDHRKADDRWDFMLDSEKRIGYIMITAFSRETYQDYAAMEDLSKQGVRGLILDLRFNPGGLLSSAIDICDLFVSEGKIVSTAGRNTKEQVWTAKKSGTYEGFPMVVLVNRYSASASEIVSACLQDHKRAVVMGERTWGKGSVQNIIELENGKSALKLTTAGYQRPSGKNIHREANAKESDTWGVMPDTGYLVKLSDAEMFDLTQSRRDRNVIRPHEKPEDKKLEDKKPEDKKPEDKKPEATKPEDKKPEDKKPEDKKPEDKKPEAKNDEKKPEEKKPDEKKSDEKKPDGKSEEKKKDDKKPDSKKTDTKKDDKKPEAAKKFVDKQLDMAIDYLRKEIDKPKTADKKDGDKKEAKPATQTSSTK